MEERGPITLDGLWLGRAYAPAACGRAASAPTTAGSACRRLPVAKVCSSFTLYESPDGPPAAVARSSRKRGRAGGVSARRVGSPLSRTRGTAARVDLHE